MEREAGAMTREQAIKALKRLFGTKLYYRVGELISSPERRAKAKSEADALNAQMEEIDAEIQRLQAAAGIPALYDRKRELRKKKEQALGWARYFKFTVGKNIGFANEITGQGDTWQEAIDASEKRKLLL